MTAAVPDPRFRDQLAEARPLANRFSEALRAHADDCICDRWVGHHSQVLAVVAERIITAEVEARVQAAANQRAAEELRKDIAALADEMEDDESIGIPPHVPLLIAALRKLASPAPAPHAEEGQR